MLLPDLVVRSRRVVTPGGMRPGAVHVRDGRIIGVAGVDDVPPGCPVDDAGGHALLPGLVDTHVHVNEPGSDASEAFERTTRSASAGGVTSILAMPFGGGAPLTSAAALESTRAAAQGHCFVDVGFWGGIVRGQQGALAALFEAGVFGFTGALAASEDDTSAASADGLKETMAALARFGAPILAHAELSGSIERSAAAQPARRWFDRVRHPSRAGRRYSAYLDHYPKAAENEAVARLIQLCQEHRLHTHIVHLSSSDVLTPIFHARSRGLPISAETCPHYLTFVAEEIPDGAVEYKTFPPIRERTNREFLWAALAGGLIQSIGSDHRPPTGHRARNFLDAGGGIASIELGLPIVWTSAYVREYTLEQVARWMSWAPARLVGFARKGAIDVGYDADLVVFDQDAEFTVEPAQPGRRPTTPYCGRRLRGAVKRTYLRGTCVYAESGDAPPAVGRLLFRGEQAQVHRLL